MEDHYAIRKADGADDSVMNLLCDFGQGDQGKSRGNDQGDRGDSSEESLCIRVNGFQIISEKDAEPRARDGRKHGLWVYIKICIGAVTKGFEVTFKGTICYVIKPYATYVEQKIEEDQKASVQYAKEEAHSKIKFKDVERLDEVSELWNYFNMLDLEEQKENAKKRNGKGKETANQKEPQEVTNLEDMVVFIDLLKVINISMLNEDSIRRKFHMVQWFSKYVLKQQINWPPKIGNQIIDLYDLHMGIQLNGVRTKVTQEDFWPYISVDLGLDLVQPYKIMLLYNEYLDIIDWYYNNLKKRREETGTYAKDQRKKSALQEEEDQCKTRLATRLWSKPLKISAKKIDNIKGQIVGINVDQFRM
ncbi:hypothetical protein E3N88_24304 [Mikania micrantha]|uniref:ARID domain-containing protein n=1 Tax=Mikania micrantha TaxID=192012 RepID=A0A5N6N2R5_9ASTR|nr:hypothetical protein E3N88_24304 [Mikania micrantha]